MPRPWMRAAVALALAAGLAALIGFGLSPAGSTRSGRPAPALPHELLAGTATTVASLVAAAHGHASVVVFWASWCGPCSTEAPALEHFSQSPEGRGRIVGIDWSDALSGARSFIHEHRWTFPNLRDSEGTVGNDYGLTGLPTTFVLDAHARVRTMLRGPQDEHTLQGALASVERS